ncbi:unnamed protein product [Adineta steineri]|uniref:Choline transporter-like protein n=2 Tax=Adineta steineri TaxID=433720 RepID=A0A815D6Y9_9BILA|nr:unnamed protein product [Adineta steineri]
MELVLNYILPLKIIKTALIPLQPVYGFNFHLIPQVVIFFLWLWGIAIFANIVRYVTAYFVGPWSSSNNADQQNTIGMCIRQTFTTYFKTICIGPQSQSATNSYTRYCQTFKMILGLMNEWDFEYEALTKQPFAQASRSVIELFKKRGWDMIMNDTLIGQFLW